MGRRAWCRSRLRGVPARDRLDVFVSDALEWIERPTMMSSSSRSARPGRPAKMMEGEGVEGRTIRRADSRAVGFADYGSPAATAVLWCHGGPGSRAEPAHLAPQARRAGLRIIGVDRPGYGLSTPQPGRTIAGWVPDALAVADHLGIGQFVTVGTSTGGAFALALAAVAPERVLGVVARCSMTDARWPEGRATMSRPHTHAVWDAPIVPRAWPPPSTRTARTAARCAETGWRQ